MRNKYSICKYIKAYSINMIRFISKHLHFCLKINFVDYIFHISVYQKVGYYDGKMMRLDAV